MIWIFLVDRDRVSGPLSLRERVRVRAVGYALA
jgi:hypothetical protein